MLPLYDERPAHLGSAALTIGLVLVALAAFLGWLAQAVIG